MKADRLENMVKGWFVGAFDPTVLATNDCEVAVKRYSAGEAEQAHYHKIATEVTLILDGLVEMCGRTWGAGDIVTIPPGEATAFRALEDATTVVVKVPGVLDDKYMVDS